MFVYLLMAELKISKNEPLLSTYFLHIWFVIMTILVIINYLAFHLLWWSLLEYLNFQFLSAGVVDEEGKGLFPQWLTCFISHLKPQEQNAARD